MDYKRFDKTYYIRADKGDEIISCILEVCRNENIRSAVFSGIGGCEKAELQTFIPETGSFDTCEIFGMLELISLNGNVVTDEKVSFFIILTPRFPTYAAANTICQPGI